MSKVEEKDLAILAFFGLLTQSTDLKEKLLASPKGEQNSLPTQIPKIISIRKNLQRIVA